MEIIVKFHDIGSKGIPMQEIGKLRAEIWNSHLPPEIINIGRWLDDIDLSAFHWTVWNAKELVGSARLSFHELADLSPEGELLPNEHGFIGKTASMNRLVISPPARRKGLANQLDSLRIEFARKLKAKNIVISLSAEQPWRIESLERRGFQVVSTGLHSGLRIQSVTLGYIVES